MCPVSRRKWEDKDTSDDENEDEDDADDTGLKYGTGDSGGVERFPTESAPSPTASDCDLSLLLSLAPRANPKIACLEDLEYTSPTPPRARASSGSEDEDTSSPLTRLRVEACQLA